MEVVDVRSSSNDLSSAPNSDVEGSFVTSHLPSNIQGTPNGTPNQNNTSSITFDMSESKSTGKIRRPRAKKIKEADAPASATEKKPRKPRSDKGLTMAARRKMKEEQAEREASLQAVAASTDLAASRLNQPTPFIAGSAPPSEAAKFTQNGLSYNTRVMQSPSSTPYNTTPQLQHAAPKPRAMFDPVRGMTTERSNEPSALSTPSSHLVTNTPPRNPYQPLTSPSLNSIMNHPDVANNTRTSTVILTDTSASNAASVVPVFKSDPVVAMEVDQPVAPPEKKPASDTSTTKPVSKPRAKEQPPPLPTGSGLLSSSLFGGDSGVDSKQNEKGPNIVLHIDLKDPNNRVINFARLAEEKYGFAALYPRQAAQKERLARVAAATAALDRSGSGNKGGLSAGDSGDDDHSVDIDPDSDNDGDVAMSGVNGTGDAVNSGTDGPTRKRRKRKDEYDAEDPFVDDSELLWEAQAAASKDGFFVYCGPLVPEGEKPAIERADGTVKRGRGRGRGGGPGSRGGRGAAAAARDVEGVSSSGRGGGPGSRGGNITRKPRIKKAERELREMEKKQKEQMTVLAAKPPAIPS